jgi:hypothetical protein
MRRAGPDDALGMERWETVEQIAAAPERFEASAPG